MAKDTYEFPAIFHYEENSVGIEFPDLPGCLPCAETPEKAFHVAKEALGLHLWGMEKDNDVIPEPTPVASLHVEDNCALAMIDVFMPIVREKLNKKTVKKTLSIPAWLNAEAEAVSINFSQVLQDALIAKLQPQT